MANFGKCFLVTASQQMRVVFRRSSHVAFNGFRRHQASAPSFQLATTGDPLNTLAADKDAGLGIPNLLDVRWPTVCDDVGCGYLFVVTDIAAAFLNRLYDDGLGNLKLPPEFGMGSTWTSPDYPGFLGPDGKALFVVLPSTETFFVDGPQYTPIGSQGHGPNTPRAGTPPNMTVSGIETQQFSGQISAGNMIGTILTPPGGAAARQPA